ncbi:HAD family hydrolase [Flavicella sp.]|uniref:HAD family hydrolase n=1 Tax=Flavicella sp. TaxID=2957742 RepID=UPI003019E95D
MNIKGIIFDLDGTLVNSIEDIADSMNVILKDSNYPTHSYKSYESFIGSGIQTLVSRALPTSVRTELEIERVFKEMLNSYKDNCTNKTAPYPGILDLLKKLEIKGLKMSVLSNKEDRLTKRVVAEKLPSIFEPVFGLTTEELKKPNPKVILQMCTSLELDIKKIIYVGDSVIDMQTARNAGLQSVAVTWGFQSKESLLAENPDYIIDTPEELFDIID